MASSDQATVKVEVQLDLAPLIEWVEQGKTVLHDMGKRLDEVQQVLTDYVNRQPQPGHEPRGGAECGREGGPCVTGHRFDESCQLDPPGSDRALYIEDVREERPSERAMRLAHETLGYAGTYGEDDSPVVDYGEPLDLTPFRVGPLTTADGEVI